MSNPPPFDRTPSPREELETGFTPILRKLWEGNTAVSLAALVDHEGECVDYFSTRSPYDTKVAAAHWLVVTMEARERFAQQAWGEIQRLQIDCTNGKIFIRRITEEYVLIVTTDSKPSTRMLTEMIERACFELRSEMGILAPLWDIRVKPLEIRVRKDSLGQLVPVEVQEHGLRREIAAVLGRASEKDAQGNVGRTYYRVRTYSGEELGLVYDPALETWTSEP